MHRVRKALKQSMFVLVELKPLVNPDYKTPGPAKWQGLVNLALTVISNFRIRIFYTRFGFLILYARIFDADKWK